MKRKLDAQLPGDRLQESSEDILKGLFRAPQVRKGFIERLKGTKGVVQFFQEIGNTLSDLIIKREDEDQFGIQAELDAAGRPLNTLPVYYTTKLGRRVKEIKDGKEKITFVPQMQHLSLDATSNMIVYANMANNFDEMSKVVDALDVMRDVIREMKIGVKKSGKQTVKKIKYAGREFRRLGEIKGEQSDLLQRFDDYLAAQVYGQYKKDAGNFGKTNISKTKSGDLVNMMVSLNGMAFNLPAGITNILLGKGQRRIDSIAESKLAQKIFGVEKQFFTYEDS